MKSLRSSLIRLAYQRPEIRGHLFRVLKSAGDVVPFRPRVPRNPHTVTIAGDKYVLSTNSGGLAGDLSEEPEESEYGARVIRGPVADPWKFLWAYDTDKQIVAMWRVTDGSSKEWGPARAYATLIPRLEKKNEINRVSHQEFSVIEREMSRREDENTRALEQWAEEIKTDDQRDVESLVLEYFSEKVRPVMDRAVRDVERGVIPLGFKADPGGFPVERQMKSYVTGRIYEKLFDLNSVNAYVKSKGVDLDSLDVQATQWARDDVWFDYIRSVLH